MKHKKKIKKAKQQLTSSLIFADSASKMCSNFHIRFVAFPPAEKGKLKTSNKKK
jgi:hypothetical protein